jgi:hypothetical protein
MANKLDRGVEGPKAMIRMLIRILDILYCAYTIRGDVREREGRKAESLSLDRIVTVRPSASCTFEPHGN